MVSDIPVVSCAPVVSAATVEEPLLSSVGLDDVNGEPPVVSNTDVGPTDEWASMVSVDSVVATASVVLGA